ncbi:MAG TPA: hypothetical protein EYP23_05040 [Thermoplasmata archaeon]|nr:hypothetical protein [Thermoplasmata archaeon]
MKKIRINFLFNLQEDLKVVMKSLEPEIKKRIPKTTVKLDYKGGEMVLTITAKDTSSLRAACNSYLRWVDTALNVRRCFVKNQQF